jgi:hypothetical protein
MKRRDPASGTQETAGWRSVDRRGDGRSVDRRVQRRFARPPTTGRIVAAVESFTDDPDEVVAFLELFAALGARQ